MLEQYWEKYNTNTDSTNPVDNEWKVIDHLRRHTEIAYKNSEQNPLGWNVAHLMMQMRISTYDIGFGSGVHPETVKKLIRGANTTPGVRTKLVGFMNPKNPDVPKKKLLEEHLADFYGQSRELLHDSSSAYIRWILELVNSVGREHFEETVGTRVALITHYFGKQGNLPDFAKFQKMSSEISADTELLWSDPLLEEGRAAWYEESQKLGRPHVLCKFIAAMEFAFPDVPRDRLLIKVLGVPGEKAYKLLNYSFPPLKDVKKALEIISKQLGGPVLSEAELKEWETERKIEKMMAPFGLMKTTFDEMGLKNKHIAAILGLPESKKYLPSRALKGNRKTEVPHGVLAALCSDTPEEFRSWLNLLESHYIRKRRRDGNYNPAYTQVLRDIHCLEVNQFSNWKKDDIFILESGGNSPVDKKELEVAHCIAAKRNLERMFDNYRKIKDVQHPLQVFQDDLISIILTPEDERPSISRQTEDPKSHRIMSIPHQDVITELQTWGSDLRNACIADRQGFRLRKRVKLEKISLNPKDENKNIQIDESVEVKDSEFELLSKDEELQQQKIIKQSREEMRLSIINLREHPEIIKQLSEAETERYARALMEIQTESYEDFWLYCRSGTREISELIDILKSAEVRTDDAKSLNSWFRKYCEAKQTLVNANGRWAMYLANAIIRKVGGFRSYVEGGMQSDQIDEVRGSAFLALAQCVEYLDPDREMRLSTYSKKAIEGNAWNTLSEMGRVQHIPSDVRSAMGKIRKVMHEAAAKGKSLTISEANKIAGTDVTNERLENGFQASRSVSIEAGNKDGDSPGASISASLTANEDRSIDQSSNRELIDFLIEKVIILKEPEKAILWGIHGIYVEGVPDGIEQGMKRKEIAQILGITRSRLQQREARLIREMQKSARKHVDGATDGEIDE